MSQKTNKLNNDVILDRNLVKLICNKKIKLK